MLETTPFLRIPTYAKSRGFNEHTVRFWVRNHVIPSLKIGRMVVIDPAAADAALRKRKRR